MAQARRKTRKREPRKEGGARMAAAMLLAGIAIGALATILWQGARTDADGVGAGIRQLFDDARKPPHADAAQSDAQPPQPKPSTEFTFFTVLPEIEVVAPSAEQEAEAETKTAADDSDSTQPKPAAAERAAPRDAAQYMLQAGSFRRLSDADRLKANLALQGMASAIQKISIQGRGDFYRVRLGPYPTYQAMVQADQRLAAAGIKTLRLKMNPG